MKKKILICYVLLSFMSIPSAIYAGTAENTPLSLDDTLRIAWINHPRMREAREEISASKGRWLQAEALPDPEIEFDIGGLKKGEDDARKGNLDSFAVKQPLDPLGTRFLRGRMAWDDVRIAKSGLDLIWGEVRSEVIETYYRILVEEKALDVARDNLNVTRQFFTKVEVNYQSGNALQSDVLRAKIEVSRAENEFLIAEKNLRVSTGDLNIALGREAGTPLELSGAMDYEALHYTYEQIKDEAFENRADLRAETTRLKQKKKGFWQSLLKTIFPQMAIGVERTTEDYENDTALVVEASYPLWGFNLGEVKEAKAEKEIQNIRLEALKKQVGLEVYQAFLEAELADKQVMIQQKALEEANELLRQVTVSYGEGEVPFLTYLENLKTIKETRLANYNALLNYKEKIAELERATQATPVPEGIEP
jgi:outer membrane protein TolC